MKNHNNFNSNGNGKHGVDLPQQNTSHAFHEYLAILYSGRWIIITSFLVVMSSVVYWTFTTPPTYEASTTIIIDEKKQGYGQSLFEVGGMTQQRTMINNQVEILKSRSLVKEVLERLLQTPMKDSLSFVKGIGKEKTFLMAMQILKRSISVNPVRDTDLINISVRAPTPFEAAYFTNSVATAYQELDRSFSRGEISQIVEFLDNQLERKENDLKLSEDALKGFLEKEKIASLNDEATQVVAQGAQFESLYKEALIDLQVMEKRLSFLKGQLGRSKETLEAEIGKVSSPLVLQLRNEMADIERNIAIFLSQGVGERDPQVLREREKLNAIKSRLTEEIRKLVVDGLPADDPLAQAQDLVVKIVESETEMTAIEAKANGLKLVVDSYNIKLESLPDKNVQLARLERNRKVDENLYMMMREKHEESRITKAGQIGKVRILDEAVPPVSPISPKKKVNLLLGFLLGIGLGVSIAYLRDYLDTTVRRVEDLEALGQSVLAAIPRIDASVIKDEVLDQNGNTNDRSEKTRLVTHFKPKSPVSEAYRSLRTNLQFSDKNNNMSAFLITSSGPGEGKSTTIANLAIAMSLQGTRTILVDADLRRPVIHKIFELEKNSGLTNILVGKLKVDEAIQKTNTQNLDVITSGILPPNPAELLGSKQMGILLQTLKDRYDLVLIDSPPLIAVTDAAVLAKEVTGVLLVVKSGQTQKSALTRGLELLRNVNANILGVILNDVSRENTYGSYYYYYYYHYYYYYGDEGHKRKKRLKTNSIKRNKQNNLDKSMEDLSR